MENLRETIKNHFDKAEINFDFLTAGKLIELSRREQIKTKGIPLLDNPISTQDGGYIAIAPLKNYNDFITTETGELIKYFFDSNIRDYQGNVEVNSGIKETLQTQTPAEDFWWLNNGITITASDATFGSKILQIEEPQIVNGLQTSFEIHNYFRLNKVEGENRNVLIRIVKTKDEKSRLKVIKATNSQTSIPPASLRATDPIHRDIEDFLLAHGFYYDRRKNYHKNQLRPINKIVSIPHLAQMIMSVLQQKPDYARARPSPIIKNNTDYEGIFNKNLPIEMYLKLIQIQQSVDQALKNFDSPKLTRPQIGAIKFHVSMYVASKLTNKLKPTAPEIESVDIANLTERILNEAIQNTYIVYDAMGGTDGVAKGREFVAELIEQLKDNIS